MHELEFLPDWYPRLRRSRRLLILQCWMTLAIVAGLVLWLGLARRNVGNAELALGALDAQMLQTRTEQKQLDEQLRLREQLTKWEQIIAKLGFPVEMSRLLRTLDEEMPREMSLLEIACSTEELAVPDAANPYDVRAKPQKDRPVERRLKVRLKGVAPTDVDLANFLTGLSEYRFFEQISLVGAGGLSEAGHLMREFEVTFFINLDSIGGN